MRKTALIIGNNKYRQMTELHCAVNDAESICAKLESLGFDCVCKTDIDYCSMAAVFDEFEKILTSYEVGLVYFAGHGFEMDKTNYLAMIDTGCDPSGIPVKHMAYKLDDFIDAFDRSSLRIKILILDACRSNFSSGVRGTGVSGFAPVFAPKGTIIAFSTSPGQKAIENESLGNGVYTNALLTCLDIPRIPIEGMFKRVREIVSASSKNNQIPWEHTSLLGDFYFNPDIADGESIAIYSQTALADASYMFVQDSILKDIINDLKTLDYNIQNPALPRLGFIQWRQASVNEIFVLGRNIYQTACGPSFSGQQYMNNLLNNLIRLPVDVSTHLLSGMAYEIYFDGTGKLRTTFKADHYNEVDNALVNGNGDALTFIQKALSKYDDCIIYVPGSNQKYIFSVSLDKTDDCYAAYSITDISCNGRSVFYNEEGTDKYDDSNDYRQSPESQNKFMELLAQKITAPGNMIEVVYSSPIETDFKIMVPHRFSLRWYSK